MCMGQEKERKGQCISYGNSNIGNTGNDGNHSQRFPDKEICVFRAGYGGKEAEILLSAQFFPYWRCVPDFWKRCREHDSTALNWVKYLPWQEKASSVRTGSDAAVSGHYQRASCPDNACPAVFLCAVGTGNRNLSVYPLLGIIYAASFILYEREKLAQLVS